MTAHNKNHPPEITGWCMYDWANSVYSLVISTAIFPVYYYSIAPEQIWGLKSESIRSFALSVAFFIIVILGPLLGGIADARGLKKRFLQITCYTGSASCIGLSFFTTDTFVLGLVLFIAATTSFALSDSFYNAFLPEIATPDRFDAISARGYSMGYIGSVILLIVALLLVSFHEAAGISKGEATRFSFLLTGLWWAGFGTFTFSRLRKDVPAPTAAGSVWLQGFEELRVVLKDIRSMPLIGRFILTFGLYSMGLQTVMNMATDFGTREMKLETGNLIIALLIIQLIAIPGAIFFAALSKRKSNIYALKIAVSIWVGICIAAYYIINEWQFYVLGALVGFVMGGIQSISRATYAKLLPQAHNTNASFFSLYSVTDKVATVFGTLVFGLTTQYTGSMRNATLFLIVFFVGGFILLWRTNWSLGVHVPINEPEEVQ